MAASSTHAASPGAPGHGHEAHGERHYVKIWAILCVLLAVSIIGPMFGIRLVTLVTAFGAVFTDVDEPHGRPPSEASTRLEYYDAAGQLLFSGGVPSSPGEGTLSFFGIVFPDASIGRVRITSGDVAPGPDDSQKQDVVVMDDFIYGEPQLVH